MGIDSSAEGVTAGKNEREVEAALLRDPQGEFSHADLEGLPGPVASYFRAAVTPGTPLALSARIRMRGRIKIGRWVPFTAREVLTPHVGFVWAARAAGIVAGSDRFVDGHGEMNWRLFGLVRVMQESGPDVSRSAAERAAAEAVWVPTSLFPGFGVEWSAEGDGRIVARYQIADYPVRLELSTTGGGLIEAVRFDRWGDPDATGEFGLHAFGGDFSAHSTFNGVSIPSEGRLGWHYGTNRWSEGEFFRYRITDLELVGRT
ncbi:MAG: DUF6544 family protein [Acidimicrobiia bacterium]